MDDDDERGQPLWLNTEALLEIRTSHAARGLAMSLVFEVWEPLRQPFGYDPEALAKRLTGPDATPAVIAKHRDQASRYFVILEDGRWAPSPEFFSVTDGNAEMPPAPFGEH